MPIMITVEQGAEKIIDILVKEIGLKAGQEVPAQLLKEKYRAHDYDAGDLPAGTDRPQERATAYGARTRIRVLVSYVRVTAMTKCAA
jgi:hypothetical protein